jgi:hypothetical protein
MAHQMDDFQSKRPTHGGLFLFIDEIELYMNANAVILPSVIL